MTEAEDPSARPIVSRRTLATGAAWSIPVIAMTVAAPMAAASCATPGDRTFAPGETNVRLPDCVSSINFEVVGGGAYQGRAAAISGSLVLPARGVTLRIVVGFAGTYETTGTIGGIAGFGRGGSAPASDRRGASGGAGSAIMIGNTPYVVAGGAGAFGTGNAALPTDTQPGWFADSLIRATAPRNGVPYGTGDAGPIPANGSGRMGNYGGSGSNTYENVAGGQPGRAASARRGGQGGSGIGYNQFPALFTVQGALTGNAGGDTGTGSYGGGNGGGGVKIGPFAGLEGVTGGGGGGYAGGGSGGGGYVAPSASLGRGNIFSTGGGAGSSYTGGQGVTVASITTGATAAAGRIRITWI